MPRPIARLALFGLLLAAAPAAAGSFAGDTAEYLRRLETLGFSGVVSVRTGDGVILERGYGLADREAGRPYTPETVSTIGSITKQFTAALILELQEEGLVRVTDTLGDHFDDVPFDKRSITVHQLLTHTSGIPDPPGYDDFTPNTRAEYVARVLQEPLRFPPGTDFRYSNANYSLLGAIAEQRTGLGYEEALRARVLEPAGLDETGYVLPEWDPERVAVGYRGGERWGTVLERPMGPDGPYWALRANGGLHSTPADMQDWARALLEDRVLTAESRAALWGDWIEPGSDTEYAYGWDVRDLDGHRVITHNGGNGILFADLYLAPDDDVSVFLQCNVIADFRLANTLGETILERYLTGAPYPEAPDASLGRGVDLAPLAGRYVLPEGGAYTVTADGDALRIEAEGRAAYALLHSEPGVDLAEFARRDAVLHEAVGRYLQGDVGGFVEAYEGRVERATLEDGLPRAVRDLTEQAGTLEGHAVLGTQTSARGDVTLVRIDGSWGSAWRPYVWSDEGDLLGYMPRPDGLDRRWFVDGEGVFLSWCPELPGGARVAFTADGLRVGGPDGPVAIREPADR